jgi:hypothetical protein
MKGFRFLEIVWLDACSGQEWCGKDDLPSPVMVTTRGWCVFECPEYLVMAGTFQHHADGHVMVGECIAVPAGCISQIAEIQLERSGTVLDRARGTSESRH